MRPVWLIEAAGYCAETDPLRRWPPAMEANPCWFFHEG